MQHAERVDTFGATQPHRSVMRFLSLGSLAGILAAALLLVLVYRQVAVAHLVELSELNTSTLAQSLFNSVRREFMAYLNDENAHHLLPLPDALRDAIRDLTDNTQVTSVRILDDEGIVVFATTGDEIGHALVANADSARALQGEVVSRLTTRDGFQPLAVAQKFNLLQSYVPIRGRPAGPVLGVFLIDTDVTSLFAEIGRFQLEIFVASTTIMLVLYLLVLAMARHADRIARRTEQALRERSSSLTLLSQQLISAQESEKKRIHHELHEGIVQAMCALKLQVEGLCCGTGRTSVSCSRLRKTVVPMLQDMVQGARTLAEDLYPPTLSDFGLLQTLDWYFREFGKSHPSLQVEWVTSLAEDKIAVPLKTVLFRLIEDLTKYVARDDNSSRLRVTLGNTANQLVLEIAVDGRAANLDASKQDERRRKLITYKERIIISGGHSQTHSNSWGGTTLHAEWPASFQ